MRKNSKIMNLLLKINLESLAWSFRRVHVPVNKKELVLEVGSGGNPYFRSNVLIDAYLDTRERHYVKLISDRPTVLGFAENLPFRDDSFDFVIASHVLEHSKDPEKFLSELQRVSKAGYIEVPDAFFERLANYLDHRLEITDIDSKLIIRKKKNYIQDQEIHDLVHNKVSEVFEEIVSKYPFRFNVRYYWSRDNGGIKYEILNPNYEFDWDPPLTTKSESSATLMAIIKGGLLKLFRKYLSQNKRNKSVDLLDIIMCPNCRKSEHDNPNGQWTMGNGQCRCNNCNSSYDIIKNNIIKFN
jgi:SAM-dependent methyltransferase/uncharacterized protein YbaR (Trm112 family)